MVTPDRWSRIRLVKRASSNRLAQGDFGRSREDNGESEIGTAIVRQKASKMLWYPVCYIVSIRYFDQLCTNCNSLLSDPCASNVDRPMDPFHQRQQPTFIHCHSRCRKPLQTQRAGERRALHADSSESITVSRSKYIEPAKWAGRTSKYRSPACYGRGLRIRGAADIGIARCLLSQHVWFVFGDAVTTTLTSSKPGQLRHSPCAFHALSDQHPFFKAQQHLGRLGKVAAQGRSFTLVHPNP